ncbi:hypothetical protein L914_08422 [Phytophthora nicotianae]|uniref:Uncharacterized protein n=1 Tax=Phytophthora nicotianae TaxID=4792 RepID=W2NGC9_PHYNI|nr:hypothetical protein L914_08422 [Phytophthora nicotianae]
MGRTRYRRAVEWCGRVKAKPLAKSLAVLMIVPIPGDCNFEQKYTVAMSMDEKVFTSVDKLQGKPQVKADVDPDDDS